MSTLVTILHVIVCLFLMLTVLLQSGKGGGMGAAFGGGGNAATVFGGSGASGFLKRLTAIAGTIFMITSMILAFVASHNSADALEKFGAKEQSKAEEKERAKAQALQGSAGSGSAGSAALTPLTPPPGTSDGSAAAPAAGSAAPATMSSTPEAPAAGSAEAPAAGSAEAPAAGSAAAPATPAPPPASSTPNAPKP